MVSSAPQYPHGPVGITILGATGSIGVNTLKVVARHPERYRVIALSANSQVDRLVEQCLEFRPEYAVLGDALAAERAQGLLAEQGNSTQVLFGEDALETIAGLEQSQQVMAAIVGAAGLRPTLAAVRAGKRVLLANKESLVMAGQLFMDEVHRCGAELLPIDSEHNAIFQSMPTDFDRGLKTVGVRQIMLTASGGPFLNLPLDTLAEVTPDQACKHPKWKMGRKISVDSATMMNKGLEVIEACWLFGATVDEVQVLVHPQSVIHSLVEYDDGSVLAQLGNPDMRTPIAHAMAWPERIDSGVSRLNLVDIARLDFEAPDFEAFPCLRLAFEAMRRGGTAPASLNAANEIAVQAFLDEQIAFTKIADVIEQTMQNSTDLKADTLAAVLEADRLARDYAGKIVAGTDPQDY